MAVLNLLTIKNMQSIFSTVLFLFRFAASVKTYINKNTKTQSKSGNLFPLFSLHLRINKRSVSTNKVTKYLITVTVPLML